MTYNEVCDILGKQGTLQATSSVSDYTVSIYCWENEYLYNYACISVTFENGIVSSKAQAGLS